MKTAVVAAIGALLVTAGCSGGPETGAEGRPTPDAHGTASAPPGQLLLRKTKAGGIAGLGGPGTLPDVSVYTDGVAIVAAGAQPARYRLTRRAIARLESEAEAAGLATPRTVDDPHVADAMYTMLTYVAGGAPRTTKIIQAGGQGDRAAAFAERLDPRTWSRADQTASPTTYEPTRVAALAVQSPGEPATPWPFAPLARGATVGMRTCTILTGNAAERAGGLSSDRLWRDEHKVYRVTFRPLLPDESSCAHLKG